MRITLNLATRPFADLGPAMKRLRIAMGALALTAILLGVALHAIHQKAESARARDHSLDGQIARIAQEQQRYQQLMQQPANAQVLKQSAVLNRLFDAKAFSWTLAMEDLETVLPSGVQVTTLEPDRGKDGRILVRLRVLGPRDRAVDLVRNLEHSRHFLLPRIVSENAESQTAPGQRLDPVSASDRVQFDLLAEYNPNALEVQKTSARGAARPESAEEDTPSGDEGAGRALPQHRSRPSRVPYTGAQSIPSKPVPGGPQ